MDKAVELGGGGSVINVACHGLPRRCSSLRRPRVTLPQPSWRVTLFPSAVWNSLVVQKTDFCRLQQRRCE